MNISKITNSILQKKNANNSVENYKITEESLLIGGYGQIFESTLYVYKYNWLIGSGTKSFQKKCYKLSETKKNLSCPPHPHNIYLDAGSSLDLFLKGKTNRYYTSGDQKCCQFTPSLITI